jgi:hypothetical protein
MDKGYVMSCASRSDYLQRIYPRYQEASWEEKQRILDEFCANCDYHRKYAIRVLNGPPPAKKRTGKRRRRRSKTYSSRRVSILKAVWEAADYPWSVRLKALLPEWMPWIRLRFRLTPDIERQLLQISARSIDLRLRSWKRKLRRRLYGRTKPGTLLKPHIPLKTDPWDVQVPGFTEIDLVSHSGDSAAGDFCYSLNLTDIHTGWTEARAVRGKGQEGVRQALEAIRQTLPFPLRGIDSDNGSEFINQHLFRYCRSRAIQITRGRPYKKDDNPPNRAEELDACAATAWLRAVGHGGGAAGDQRSLCQRAAAVSEPLSSLGEAREEGAGRLELAPTLRRPSDPVAANPGVTGCRSRACSRTGAPPRDP